MNEALEKAWEQAATHLGTPIDIGRVVVCDICSKDWTDLPGCGGFIFASKAYCPDCAPSGLASIQKFGEAHYIRARCPEGQSFADFVREGREGNNTIRISKLELPRGRDEHLAWAKQRALEYCDRGNGPAALASMGSDLSKHPQLRGHPGIELGMVMLLGGHLREPRQMREFIEGFR